MKKQARLYCLILFCLCLNVFSDQLTVTMHQLIPSGNGQGKVVGTITLQETKYGVMFIPNLKNLPPGPHGFHIHVYPDCSPTQKNGKVILGGAAGGHFDPEATKKHLGPYNNKGHLGDLPVLFADLDGNANVPLLAPRLHILTPKSHALIIHAEGDNYSDDPNPMGGAGNKIACGVMPTLKLASQK